MLCCSRCAAGRHLRPSASLGCHTCWGNWLYAGMHMQPVCFVSKSSLPHYVGHLAWLFACMHVQPVCIRSALSAFLPSAAWLHDRHMQPFLHL